jgi:hypothetical protein
MTENLATTDVCLERAASEGDIRPVRRRAILVSLVLHGAVLALLIYHSVPQQPENRIRSFPVELVTLTPRTETAPLAKQQPARQQSASVIPQVKKSPPQIIPLPLPRQTPAAPQAGSEPVPEPPTDELQSRLDAFAKLSLPGNAAITATGNGNASGPSAYDVKDFVRAQVERRWNVDLDALADRNITVSIHVVLTPDGTIKAAEIIDDQRANAGYHSLALSARNAVILSSPIALPVGTPASALDMVLILSPKDVLR